MEREMNTSISNAENRTWYQLAIAALNWLLGSVISVLARIAELDNPSLFYGGPRNEESSEQTTKVGAERDLAENRAK
jgi:hypothetical protein